MKRHLSLLIVSLALLISVAHAADPLRVFIRGGESNRGQQAHAHPRFLAEWKKLLADRGMKVDGATDWPNAEQIKNADVIVAYAQDGGNATPEQQKLIGEFTKRGGGLVVIHTAAVSNDPPWWKSVIGGAWVPGKTKWKEGPMDLYYTENQRLDGGHPITKGASNFHIDDEVYYDMDIAPEARVLATTFTPNVPAGKKVAEGGKANIHDIQPQMWIYEKDGYRAFVSIPGHLFSTFEAPNYRAILLRGIAWAGKRTDVNEFVKPDESEALLYPAGGPQRPADTLKALEIHPDFTLKLVAAEPLISKPMNFDWDPAGRLWVAETPEYPNGRRGMRPDYRGKEWKDHGGIDLTPGVQDRPAIDKISILTDSNGDGVMDKKDIFYEGLDLVTGLVFHRDGVIVTQAPDILWLRDTNADGKADKVEKLYTGLGTGDTHAVINNPRWGWDGWIYATHGYSASSNVLNAKGEKQANIGSGVVRFLPDGSKIEQYSSKGGNTWGLQITGDNRVMWTQPTSGTLLNQVVLPEYALSRGKVGKTASFHTIIADQKSFPAMSWEQMAYVQIDRVGDFTAGAGCVIYDGGAWPQEYNGDYLTTECTINLIAHQRLTPKGSSYTAAKLPGREQLEFIRSKDMWWRPIEVRVGPDGAVYVADFYNQAVIHNDTRGPDHNRVNAAVRPDRDHYFGRIWRLDHKQAKKLEVPDLSKADVAALVKAIGHPNRHVRMNAQRLLLERPNPVPPRTRLWTEGEPEQYADLMEKNYGYKSLLQLGLDPAKPAEARVSALWILGRREAEVMMLGYGWEKALADKDPVVRRNAAQISELPGAAAGSSTTLSSFLTDRLVPLVADADAQVRVAALQAIGSSGRKDDSTAAAIVAAWPKFDDDFQKSAAVGALTQNSAAAITAILDSSDASLAQLVSILSQSIGEKNDAAAAAKLVVALSAKPASADGLKRSILDTLGKSLKDTPAMTPELSAALGKLLASGASGSVLPLAAKWDKAGALKAEVTRLTSTLLATLNNAAAPEAGRLAAAESLLGMRSANPQALPAVLAVAIGQASPTLQRQLIAALGETADPSVGAALAPAFGKLPAEAQGPAFEVLLQRADWSLALLDAVKAKQADVTNLGPANLARLRTHPDKAVAARANAMLDELFGPALKAKSEALARLTPIVEQPGNLANGKLMFTAACATCHKLGDVGTDIGPALTGMGAHGPAELLTAIVDPNREVEPSFVAWNVETRDGKFHSGIIVRENPTNIVLKSLAGQEEIKVADIKSRVNTGRSLMPEGLEGLGGETLRDILAYMVGTDGQRFRMLDLREAFTANSARGLYVADNAQKSIDLAKGGAVNVGGIPFNVILPEKALSGKNVITLKGGPENTFARRAMPTSVEIKGGGFKANRLHFLGGIGGWAYPYDKGDQVVMTATVQYAGGGQEKLAFKNGVEFADHNGRNEVPGSEFANGLSKGFQVRWFSKPLTKGGAIEKIVLESPATIVAPTTLAITAELADANAKPLPAAAPPAAAKEDAEFKPQFTDPVPQPPATRPANGPRVLLVGGGSSHDFVKFFGATDKGILAPQVGWVDFTQNANGVAPILKNVDVLVWSANQPISAETRQALLDYTNSGKGLVAFHPGTWYAWANFPRWNKEVVGGGARGHDKLGEFEVVVTNAAHPITAGVPASFKITDELYYFQPDSSATPVEILATATSTQKPGTYPQVFVVKHPKSRIVGLTLGHDARAHDLPAFQALLKNAVAWAAGK